MIVAIIVIVLLAAWFIGDKRRGVAAVGKVAATSLGWLVVTGIILFGLPLAGFASLVWLVLR